MLVEVQDWVFEIDTKKTEDYSKRIVEYHCMCGYCRNYYAAVSKVYPQLQQFLTQFGAHVEGPDELMPFDPTVYTATYCICGKIHSYGSAPIQIDGLAVEPVSSNALDFETECPRPYFAFNTSYMQMPWLLDENMEDVISPANEPEYLERMWNKLLQNAPDDHITS